MTKSTLREQNAVSEIIRLKYRLKDISAKSNQKFQEKLSEDDFEFFVVNYT